MALYFIKQKSPADADFVIIALVDGEMIDAARYVRVLEAQDGGYHEYTILWTRPINAVDITGMEREIRAQSVLTNAKD